MGTSFPGGLDALTNPLASDELDAPDHADQHTDINDAMEAVQTKVGVDASAVSSSHDFKIAALVADLAAHLADVLDAHAASAILVDPSGWANSASIDGQGVLGDFDDELSQRAAAVHTHSQYALGGYVTASDSGNTTLTLAATGEVMQRRIMTADLIYTLPAVPADGTPLVLMLVQDGTGGRDATFAAPGGSTLTWQTSTGAAPVQNTAASAFSLYTFLPDSVSSRWIGFGASELVDHINDTAGAHAATAISASSATLVGVATDVQGVLEELDNGIADHLADASAAHAASAVSFSAASGIVATDVQAAIVELATPSLNSQVGTTYTLALTDRHDLVELTNGSAIALTVPTNAVTAFPIGSEVDICQGGAGQVTVGGAGVTIKGTPTLKLRAQESGATLRKVGTDTWRLFGDLAAT